MNARPVSVTIVGCVYMVVGAIGFVHHLTGFRAGNASRYDVLWIELIQLLAIASGIWMLRGHNWARWLALAWIGFHVILSAFHSLPELAIHGLFLTAIAWFLFRPDATRYFRASRT
jgi:hypothetical protein